MAGRAGAADRLGQDGDHRHLGLGARPGDAGAVPRRLWLASDRRVIADQAARWRRSSRDAWPTTRRPRSERSPGPCAHRGGGPDGTCAPACCAAESRSTTSELLDPLTPMAVATTVDQVGSRLLWRAYGASPRAWPIWAGLGRRGQPHCARRGAPLGRGRGDDPRRARARRRRAFHQHDRHAPAGSRPGLRPRRNGPRHIPVLRPRLAARRLVVLRKAADVGEAMAAAA